ncbi:hypothetical protein EGH24_10560 [Halonotius terrestris]|uniref:DUF7975 domain-containing protein n=1 Tax=Halonotius terrestris TaxID=2487750 RepID=A0A8J8PAZ6_9EURY|nr:hypothetical protein [Halonotius terrestris]TQQ79915.1 hypothetical protein EGH24_10560 [Halonotius terrestris]
MTRFDASEADARRELFTATVTAHRERGSEFCTLEPDETAPDADDELVPWIQFGSNTVALDCTDSELDRLKELLGEYPDFRIDDLESPEEAEGTHVRITTHSDEDRLAEFFESVFQQAFGYPADYRVWAVSV